MTNIKIDYSRDALFDELGIKRLRESYMRDSEKSPQERYAFVADTFGSNPEHAQRLYDYASQHWLSFSTPILSYGKSPRGLPISCFLSYLADSSEGLIDTLSEVNSLSMMGGGVGIGVGIRAADEKSTGVMPHLKIYDSSCLAYTQSGTRRGTYATYLDLDHPDILKYLDMRKPTGDYNIRCMNLHQGVNIPDSFMKLVDGAMKFKDFDDSWQLIDKASGKVRETVSAKWLWQKLLETRMLTGEPYFLFIDTANKALPDWLVKQALQIKQSNICSEVIIPTSEDRTAVCCLSSLNLKYYDKWCKNSQFIRDVAEMLDNALELFINKAPNDRVKRAIYSASRGRDIGIGVLGFHTFLQEKGVAFDSVMAKSWNKRVFKHIREEVDKANLELGAIRGEAPDCKGTGRRFSMTMAVAPTASTSLIMGNISPSVEPMRANAYRQDTMSGAYLNKNKVLDKIIKEYCEAQKRDYDEVWLSIISNEGSVQHLDWLDQQTKDIFKTAVELDQRWIIELAADRQEYIDQAQSINLFFRPNVSIPYLHHIHYLAWQKGLKTLYYCRSEKLAKADKVAKQIEREIIQEVANDDGDCLACQA